VGVMLIEEPMVDLDDSASSHDFDDFEHLDGGSNLGLREEPGSPLDCLCARRERVARRHFRPLPGLPLRMELTLHDYLIHQLGSELACHRSRQNDVKDQLSKWSKSQQSRPDE